MSGNRGIWPRALAHVRYRSPLAASLVLVMAAVITAIPSEPVEAASPTCGPSGGHTICISMPSTTISGPALISVTNTPNSGNLVVTWTPAGKASATLMQQGGPSALTAGVDYSFLWPTQKYLDATGTLNVYFGGTGNTPVSVSVSLVNGNQTQIQKSPNDWTDFLPPTTWSGTSDPIIAAVGDGAYGTMVPQSVVTSIVNADPAVFIYLGDVYESGTYTELYSHYGALALNGDPGTQWGTLASITQPTVGNHELPSQAAWQDFWHQRPDRTSFDFGGVRFIDLNSSATMSPGSSQYAFAQASLGSSAPACIVGIWHIPPILESANQAKILPMWALFANAGGDLVLNGHAHANVEYKPMDASLLTGQPGSHMVDLIAGSSGDVLGSGGTDPRLAWKPQVKTIAVLYLTLNGAANGGIATSISWVYKDLSGTVLRSGSINCGGGGGGDTAAPNTTVTAPAANAVLGSSAVTMTGTASDNVDVDRVNVTLQNTTTGAWLQPNGTFGTSAAVVTATLVNDTVTATGWQVSATLPNGSYALTATAVDTSAIADPSPATRSFSVSVASGPPVIFSDDFTAGFANWSGVTNLSIDNTTGGVAPPSARSQLTSVPDFAFKNLTGSFNNVCMSTRVNVASIGSSTVTVLRLRTAANGNVIRVFANQAGVLHVRSDVSGTQKWSGVAIGSGWHTVELCGTVGANSTWDLYRDGAVIVNDWAANTGTTGVGRVEIGDTLAKIWNVHFDDVVVDQTPG